MIDTKELRRLTQEATPGPWKMLPVGDGRQKFAVADSEFLSILTVTDEGGATFGTVYDDADAKFIAAANPAAVLGLLDRLAHMREARDNARAEVERLTEAVRARARHRPRPADHRDRSVTDRRRRQRRQPAPRRAQRQPGRRRCRRCTQWPLG